MWKRRDYKRSEISGKKFEGANLSLVNTANVSGIEENSSKQPISNLLTETSSQSSITILERERERERET